MTLFAKTTCPRFLAFYFKANGLRIGILDCVALCHSSESVASQATGAVFVRFSVYSSQLRTYCNKKQKRLK